MDSVVSPAAPLYAFVETSDDAVVSHDAGGNVTTWNHTAERLFGYPAKEILCTSIPTRSSRSTSMLESIEYQG